MAKSTTTGAALPIDPTANVIALSAAEAKRQDDLRKAEALRQDQLRIKTEECANEIQRIHAMYQSKLAEGEAKMRDALAKAEQTRIDALFAKQESDAAILELRTSTQASTLSESVAATAKAFADQTSILREVLEKRLSLVEQNQYQSGGRDLQRTQERQGNQWAFGLVVAVLAAGFSGLIVLLVNHLK